jgi:hypothetical protein
MDVTFKFKRVKYDGEDQEMKSFANVFEGKHTRVKVEKCSDLRAEISKKFPEAIREKIQILEITLNGRQYDPAKTLEEQFVCRGTIVGISLGIDLPKSYVHVSTTRGGKIVPKC